MPPLRRCIDCRMYVRAWSRHCRCKRCEAEMAKAVTARLQAVRPPSHDGIPF